ncbi:Pro-kumamolisin, activation domain-containing protein [Pterulicium gracile]|uniref:Pro-kumamolisin, activation domain-containing protein n=1 Tax=Pterulicium gracile TaxID=1884261 RepID=A0A5C3Q2J4_9AGAR|nr:Pro-kumamolisin, activation domain-containing protein [Pterula gracilis]
MISAGFILLAAVILGHAVPQHVHQQRDTPPDGFKVVGVASPAEKSLYAAASPGSESYGNHLDGRQYLHQVQGFAAPSKEALTAVSSWLSINGLSSSALTPAGDWISVNATIEQANRLLTADFTTYKQDDKGETITRSLSYSLPAEVKGRTLAVHPTTSIPITAVEDQVYRRDGDKHEIPLLCKTDPDDDSWEIWTRSGTLPWTFSVSGFNNYFANENETRSSVGASAPLSHERATQTGQVALGMGMAPNTPVTFMSIGTEESGDPIVWFIDQATYLLGLETPPKVLVHAFPVPEGSVDPTLAMALCNSYTQLAARGVTLVHSVGSWNDMPNAECGKLDVPFSASCPYVAAKFIAAYHLVDGPDDPNPIFIEEERIVTATGFLDTLEDGTLEGKYNPSGRAGSPLPTVPDLTMYMEYSPSPYGYYNYGHPMFSAALFEGVVALLNEELADAGKPPLGFLYPFLFRSGVPLLG